MNARKIAFGLMTLSFIFIISGGVSSFVIGLQEDHKETYKRIEDVNNSFENFSTNTSVFETFRDDLYNVILGNTYYDTMYEDDSLIKNKLSNYEHLVDELMKNTYELNHLCEDMYYPDSSVNNKCNNYKSIYEQVMNYFVSDIQLYNRIVVKYNEYQSSKASLLRIREYTTNKDYIDYNNDGKFDGKEE